MQHHTIRPRCYNYSSTLFKGGIMDENIVLCAADRSELSFTTVEYHEGYHSAWIINSWIVILSKVPLGESPVSFAQDWITYRNGFGDLVASSNYWLGNEVMYSLTSTGQYQLSVEVTNHHHYPRGCQL